RGSGCPREHDVQDVAALVVAGERAEAEERVARVWREPRADVRRRLRGVPLPALEAHERVAQVALEDERVVLRGLDAYEQAVERRDLDSRGVEPALERLHERRPRAGEGVEHAA